jgi:hypothetical protein
MSLFKTLVETGILGRFLTLLGISSWAKTLLSLGYVLGGKDLLTSLFDTLNEYTDTEENTTIKVREQGTNEKARVQIVDDKLSIVYYSCGPIERSFFVPTPILREAINIQTGTPINSSKLEGSFHTLCVINSHNS